MDWRYGLQRHVIKWFCIHTIFHTPFCIAFMLICPLKKTLLPKGTHNSAVLKKQVQPSREMQGWESRSKHETHWTQAVAENNYFDSHIVSGPSWCTFFCQETKSMEPSFGEGFFLFCTVINSQSFSCTAALPLSLPRLSEIEILV